MLGHYTRVERPMERGEDIIDITTTDKSVVLYNNKYYRSGVPVPLWPIKAAHLGDYLIKHQVTLESVLTPPMCVIPNRFLTGVLT